MTTPVSPKQLKISKTVYAILSERPSDGPGGGKYRDIQKISAKGELIGQVKFLAYSAKLNMWTLWSGHEGRTSRNIGMPKQIAAPEFLGAIPVGARPLDEVVTEMAVQA